MSAPRLPDYKIVFPDRADAEHWRHENPGAIGLFMCPAGRWIFFGWYGLTEIAPVPLKGPVH